MKSQRTRKSIIYSTSVKVKRNIFLTSFILASLFIVVLILHLIDSSFPDQDELHLIFGLIKVKKNVSFIFIGIMGSIIATAIGSFLAVLFDLPSIFLKFDDIKNDIADRKIENSTELATRLNEFFVKTLRYTFLSVDYSLIKILKHPIQASSSEIINSFNEDDLNKIEKYARNSTEAYHYRTFFIDGKKMQAYVVPIYFVSQYLGFWIVLSGNSLLKPFVDFLADIEDHLIDDQVVHTLNNEKMILQRGFYLQIDALSDKITLGKYTSLNEYAEDVIRLTVKTCRVIGGTISTVYSEQCFNHFNHDIGESDKAKLIDAAIQLKPLKPKIIKLPEHKDIYVFILPIIIKELRGFLYLFDDSQSNLEYFSQMLQDIENLKLDNDLEQLSQLLKLSPIRILT